LQVKEQVPFKIKNKYQILCKKKIFWLISLLTAVNSRWTIPLMNKSSVVNRWAFTLKGLSHEIKMG
jgi:hypothetical protein